MIVKLLTEHNFERLSVKGGCRGSSASTLVKISICWKSHVMAQLYWFIHCNAILPNITILIYENENGPSSVNHSLLIIT